MKVGNIGGLVDSKSTSSGIQSDESLQSMEYDKIRGELMN